MSRLRRLLLVGGLVASAVFISTMGAIRHDASWSAPLNLLLFAIGAAVYLLPTALAVYRDCKAAVWIVVVNVFLGWTILGWFAAMGWAAGGETRTQPPTVSGTHGHPLPGH